MSETGQSWLGMSAPRARGPSSEATNQVSSVPSSAALSQNYRKQPHQQHQDYGNKFHRAALDGYVDMLCEASKRDTNLAARDHHLQLTPTLVAAQCGQLEALRILVGRGGDPERVTSCGSSALHLAAARNHLNCVSFLVNFGVNMWALDNELHTAKDVAAMAQSAEVLEYLDQMMAKQSAINTKLVQKLKDKAKNGAERRLKEMRKLQMKAIKQVERDERLLAKMSKNRRLLKTAHSMSDIKLVGRSCTPATAAAAKCDEPPANCDRSQPASWVSSARGNIANYLWQSFQGEQPAAVERRETKARRARYSSSSTSGSTSGYLSSCSARSILKPSMISVASGQHKSPHRPKYSDLVAVKQEELRGEHGTASTRPLAHHNSTKANTSSPSLSSPSSSSSSSSSSGGSMLAAKLRGLGGGVSRKVHLKRLLFANAPSSPSGDQAAHDPRSGTMSRARSVPDLSAATGREEDEDEDGGQEPAAVRRPPSGATSEVDEQEEAEEEEREGADREEHDKPTCRGKSAATAARGQRHTEATSKREAPPLPPPPPPLAPAGASGLQLDQQQLLLTQCLSQLKLQQQQQQHCNEPPQLHAPSTTGQFSHSDELLQHQLNSGQFPLRPSIIKNQKRRQFKLGSGSSEEEDKQAGVLSASDSIGSVGSFVARNLPPGGPASRATSEAGAAGAGLNQQQKRLHVPLSYSASSSPPSPSEASGASSTTGSDPIQCDAFSSSSSTSVSPLDHFLIQNNLAELSDTLARERIDLEALMLLDETDLKSLNILLGPRRKLLNAIQCHRAGAPAAPLKPLTVIADTQF